MRIALAGILALLFLLSVLLDKTLRNLPAKELRRRARGRNDKKTNALYKLAAFGRSSELFLWLVAALSAAGLAVLAADSAWWGGFLVVLAALWLARVSRAPRTYDGWRMSLSALVAPLFTAIVSFLQPVLGRLTAFRGKKTAHLPSRLYEKEDLVEFLKLQARQPDNRISEDSLKTARAALELHEKTVGDVMLPLSKVKWVAANDSIGPMVMDELHQSGQTRFPVVKEVTKSTTPEIMGVLYFKDLLDHLDDKGRVHSIMHPGISYINESQDLRSALDGFLKSGQLLLIVVNNFEEVVGVVTFEDILQQVFGDAVTDDFDQYHDIRSVASRENGQIRGQPAEAEVE